MRRALALAALAAASCVPENGPMMDPGQDCLECHGAGEAPGWTAAGTWEGEGRYVYIRDATGKSLTIHTNQAGNFYTAESLTYPIVVVIDGEQMEDPVPDPSSPPTTCLDGDCCGGSRCGCNDCHAGGDD